ncbi:MAG: acyl-CoA dehydrogenase, partial [Pseudomonadota bacterium]
HAEALNDRFAGAAPFLRAWALTLGAHYLLRAAAADPGNPSREALARFHVRQLLPQALALLAAAAEGAEDLYALDPEALAS